MERYVLIHVDEENTIHIKLFDFLLDAQQTMDAIIDKPICYNYKLLLLYNHDNNIILAERQSVNKSQLYFTAKEYIEIANSYLHEYKAGEKDYIVPIKWLNDNYYMNFEVLDVPCNSCSHGITCRYRETMQETMIEINNFVKATYADSCIAKVNAECRYAGVR